MPIDFAKTFGSATTNNNAATNNATAAKPKAQFWLNVGYLTDVKDDNGECKFVSLASGIALDTMETLAVNSKTVSFAQFQAARNDLRDQLVNAAKALKPGESVVSEAIAGGLQIQIRRVSEETAALANDENPYVRKLALGATA